MNCKSSCWLSLLPSNLIMWSIISAAMALHTRHGKESHRGLVWRCLHIHVFSSEKLCGKKKKKRLENIDCCAKLFLSYKQALIHDFITYFKNKHALDRNIFRKKEIYYFQTEKKQYNSLVYVQEWRCWGMVLLQNHPLPWWACSPEAATTQPQEEWDRRLPLFAPIKHSSH